MTPELEALAEANDTLRRARHLLEVLGTTLFGAYVPPPERSPMADVLAGIKSAEAHCQRVMLASLRAPSTKPGGEG